MDPASAATASAARTDAALSFLSVNTASAPQSATANAARDDSAAAEPNRSLSVASLSSVSAESDSGVPGFELDGVPITFRRAALEEVIGLRHEILKPGKFIKPYKQDAEPGTIHFGAFAEGKAVGCATYFLTMRDDRRAWKMRGVATSTPLAGRGIGSRLLACAEEQLRRDPAAQPPAVTVWAIARTDATVFYLKVGWRPEGEVYEVPNVGPHLRIMKELPLALSSS
ncbi:hypothetical protein T492DRAFT_1089484 [Pavlovales sp. CCMP2436]|nr:hypothetical protein T492DRAFT_1089484 [Pavlovales sp. CCMP2436]